MKKIKSTLCIVFAILFLICTIIVCISIAHLYVYKFSNPELTNTIVSIWYIKKYWSIYPAILISYIGYYIIRDNT